MCGMLPRTYFAGGSVRQIGILIAGVVMLVAAAVLAPRNGDSASIALAAALVLFFMWTWLNGWISEDRRSTYSVQAADAQGERTVQVEARGEADARATAEAMGWRVVSVSRIERRA